MTGVGLLVQLAMHGGFFYPAGEIDFSVSLTKQIVAQGTSDLVQ